MREAHDWCLNTGMDSSEEPIIWASSVMFKTLPFRKLKKVIILARAFKVKRLQSYQVVWTPSKTGIREPSRKKDGSQ